MQLTTPAFRMNSCPPRRSIISKFAVLTLTAAMSGVALADKIVVKDPEPLLQPTLDIRTRYEYREQDFFDASHALTTRARIGLLSRTWNGFSVFGEFEGLHALVDDYNAGGGADPVNHGKTEILDPENAELNRLWIQHTSPSGLTAKVGRQRIIRNNAAIVGNILWRQNEQTFDAVRLDYKGDGYHFSYAISNRTQRLFGASATKFAREMDGAFHFINGSLELDDSTLSGYAYLVDVDPVAGVRASTNVGESNTFGAIYEIGGLRLEAAWQNGQSTLVTGNDYDAFYGHGFY